MPIPTSVLLPFQVVEDALREEPAETALREGKTILIEVPAGTARRRVLENLRNHLNKDGAEICTRPTSDGVVVWLTTAP